MLLADTKIPVFFVSSNERLESSRSNGDANFRYAVECICRGIEPNVYVTYKICLMDVCICTLAHV